MHSTYQSTALFLGEEIDARCLTLAFEFYQLSFRQIEALSVEVIEWLEHFLDGTFVVRRYVKNRRVSKQKLLQLVAENVKAIDMGTEEKRRSFSCIAEAYVISNEVYDSRSWDKHHTKMIRMPQELLSQSSSDFPAFWMNHFPKERDLEQILKAVKNLFAEPNRKYTTRYILPDVQSLFSWCAYENNRQEYYGSFRLDISAFCAGAGLTEVAHQFCAFAQKVAEVYVHINARVQLQPVTTQGNPHIRYFGQYKLTDDSHLDAGCTQNEWYQTYYVPGSEWFNILSPRVQSHIPDIESDALSIAGMLCARLSGGGLLVQSLSSIDEYDVAEALKVKKLIYPALFPGGSSFSLKRLFRNDWTDFFFGIHPRCDWAVVPILNDEIDIIGTDLAFRTIF